MECETREKKIKWGLFNQKIQKRTCDVFMKVLREPFA